MIQFYLRNYLRIALLLLVSIGLIHNPTAQEKKKIIYAIGDSITWGQAYGKWKDYPYLLNSLFKVKGINNVRIINEGQPGHTVQNALDYCSTSSFQNNISRSGVHYVLIMIGTNDARVGDETPLDVYIERVNKLIDLFLNMSNEDGSHPKLILSLIPPHNSIEDGEFMLDFFKEFHPYGERIPNELNPAIQQIGNDRGLLVVDNYTQLKEAGPDLMTDGVHPNQEGNQMIADAFFEVLYPLVMGQSSVNSVLEYLK